MAIYFANTEITGIKDLFPLSSKDITGLYFADTELFTVWAEYDGTLPATYSANGDYLADYHIYGAAGGVGDDSGTEYGYEVDMSVRSVNLLNWEDVKINTDLNFTTGLPEVYTGRIATKNPIDVSSYTDVTVSFDGVQSIRAMVSYFAADNTLILRRTTLKSGASIDVSSAAYMYICFYDTNSNPISKTSVSNAMLNYGSTPLPYQPYSDTITPIYIGDDPLEAIGNYADYVDYQSGKIVRSVFNHIFTGTESTWRALYDWVELFANYSITPKIVVGSAVRSQSPDGNVTFQNFTYSGTPVIHITVDGISAGADIMPYLKSLYDNGTPAVMQYVSSEPVEVDPPVPLPTLPTVDGVNIVDYAGQSTPPSRFVAKYRKEGFN